jgi:methionyl-tRNA synthetase
MPQTCNKIWQMVGETHDIEKESNAFFTQGILASPVPGTEIKKANPLFPRILAAQ